MDPNETLRLILASSDRDEAQEHCENLRDWLRAGGFAPKHPAKYWPGTGTDFAILSPAGDNGNKWEFVQYDPRKGYGMGGNRVAAWELAS